MTPRKTSQTPAPRSAPGAGDAARPPQAAPLTGEGAPVPFPVSLTSSVPALQEGSAGTEESTLAERGVSGPRSASHQMSAVVKSGEHSWSLYFSAGMTLLNANQRLHWAAKGRIVRDLRFASWALARGHVPQLDRVRIVIEYQPPKLTRTRDAGNWSPTGKALIDGLRDAKVLANDDSEHVLEEAYRIGKPTPGGRIVMHITEVLDGPP